MLEFRNIQLSDKEWIDKSLKMSDFRGCEYSFANNIAWRRLGNAKISRFEDFYICASFLEETPSFFFPAGKGDYKKLFHEFYEFSKSMDKPLVIQSVNNENLLMLKEMYGDCFLGTTTSSIKDDITTDLFLRVTIPLFTPKVNISVWMPIFEYFYTSSL